MQRDPFTEFLIKARSKGELPYVHGRSAIKPSDYFSVSRLTQLLSNPLLSPEWLQISMKGEVLVLDEDYLWKAVQKRKLFFLDKSRINHAVSQGASLVLEGLDILDERIGALCSELDVQLPCTLSNCEAFFSQRGSEAYSGHRDSDDVIVIQIGGLKRWRIHAPQQRRYFGNSPLADEQMGQVIAEITMAPGDTLFVRAGVPHKCNTEDDFSLHLSFDLCDRTPNIEQITHVANQAYCKSLAPMHASTAEVTSRYIDLLKSQGFQANLASLAESTQAQIDKFRARIAGSATLSALERFKG